MQDHVYNVLFLCTGNSARSIMAEAVLNSMPGGRFKAYSAGSHPAGQVNPFALEQIAAIGCTPQDLRSKSWDEFGQSGAPHMDFVITVCDNAAGEVCPLWPGQPSTAHWSFRDPAAAMGSTADIRHAFATVCREIKVRLELFNSLPLDKLDRMALQREMEQIGKSAP